MTDRLKGFVVSFDRDLREDDAECLKNAIGLLNFIATVEPIKAGVNDQVIKDKLKRDVIREMYMVMDKL